MDRKERVLSYIRSKEYIPLTEEELITVLDVPRENKDEFLEILYSLTKEGKIYTTKKNRYISTDNDKKIVFGVLRCNVKGQFAFVSQDNERDNDVFVSREHLNTALDGDMVLAEITGKNQNGRSEGRIFKITERKNKIIAGIVGAGFDGLFKIVPDNKKIFSKIRVSEENLNGAGTGDRVVIEISHYDIKGRPHGRVIGILGDSKSVKSLIDGIVIENGIKSEFDEETIKETNNIPTFVSQKETEGRLDLRDELIFTIDGEDARDFDDAVSVKILENGNYYLGVHIADVTNYVKANNPLDREAFERGTSVYLADRVIPMLPEKLSCGICSLNPNVDRLAMSVFMEINHNGDVVDYEIKESVICSKERMTYENVNAIFDGDKELSKKYAHIIPTLKIMEMLAQNLRKKREARGAIQFDFPETRVKVDDEGNPTDIFYDERGISNKMIEEFMLAANETVAEFAYWAELPFVYRIHEAPSSDKITAFNKFISNFGLFIKGRADKDSPIHPKALQTVLDSVKDTPEERMIATAMLRSLMKAEYRAESIGHFGLAATYYCHFTSPIRRYPDLAIHRILKEYIHSSTKNMSEFERFAEEAAKSSSESEIKAEDTERSVEDLMKATYMRDFVGAEYEAMVSSVTSFGMFVTLPNSVEGLIRAENMSDDYYEYDEKTQSLIGKRHHKVYRIGDRVDVILARSNMELRRIDFVLKGEERLLKKFEDINAGQKMTKRKRNTRRNKGFRRRK